VVLSEDTKKFSDLVQIRHNGYRWPFEQTLNRHQVNIIENELLYRVENMHKLVLIPVDILYILGSVPLSLLQFTSTIVNCRLGIKLQTSK
jgi:hypothetical protein